ncbi:unnamed protein product [Diamesa serratosioi]
MANYIVCLIIQRLILPILLTTCCLLRPVGLSLPYLLFLFYLPFVPVASLRSFKGHTGYYLKILLFFSVILCLVQISFQILLAVLGNDLVQKCEFLELLLRHVGLVRLDNLDVISLVQWLAPEIVMFVGSIVVFIVLRKASGANVPTENGSGGGDPLEAGTSPIADNILELSPEKWKLFVGVGKVLSLLALCLTGALQPSIPSAIYFIVFLGAATWWGCNKELERAFAIVLRVTVVFLGFHITAFLGYQNPWPQELLTPNTTIPRVLGFSAIYSSSCGGNDSDIRIIDFDNNLDLDHYLSPISLIICYFILSITSVLLLGPQVFNYKLQTKTNESTPSYGSNIAMMKFFYGLNVKRFVKLKGEVFAEEEENEDGENEIGFLEQIGMAAANIATFIYKNSYIFTNVVMMAWSIVYHSWVGFVLLIWANLIWIIPNQRKNMLKTTPYLVAYAEFLLLATYLYGMDLTDDELPSNVDINGINLPQIGFIKYPHYPVGPIAIKSFFNVMFWASLRQMLQEKRSEKQSRGLADMVAPLQLTVGAATANLPKKATTESAFITKMGKLINTFLIKFWIWIVVATLFVCGTAGTQMTGFRIVYMALFLVFVLTFQFSFSRWRKFMYGFWLVVIVYSIIILVLVYTYQFDKTSSYWTEYLHISPTLQRDIGMERYATKELFLHLVTPTLIVIITVVQLHYCHSKFLELSEIAEGPEDDISKASSVAYGTFAVNKSDDENEENEENEETEDVKAFLEDIKIRKLSKQEMKNAARKLLDKVIECLEVVLLFVEIHFFKVMLFSAFILAVHGVQLIHAGFVFLSAIGLRSKTEVQLMVTRVASLISAILLITTMMYQVDYIDHNNYESNCTNSTTEDITNNAVWFGFNKADTTRNLTDLIRPYLIYIAIVSVHAVIILRQTIKRIKANKTPRTPTVVFKKIKRSDADRDIPHLLKYLVNYGFYKFGIEVCLVGFVSVIGTRMDLMACFYTVWLCLLFYLPREQLIKFWTYATYFLTAAIPIQYIILVGLPPGLCWEYPWDNVDFLEDFTIWAMLPDYSLTFKTKSKFLILDFILLLLMCRQLIVFRIEARYENSDVQYPGGSNKSVLNDIDQLGQVLFVNPTHDFIDKIRNYLDICKRFIFVIFFWATLAIVFLTGTNRVNLLSIGYIAGSFVFLWSGTDFYLRPIHTIMKWWNYLIAYNVSVVTIKTMIQMIGCLFLKLLQKQSTCWLVQMFGITCICSTKNLTPKPQSEDTCYVPIEDSGLFWDGVCFTFLIIQRRLFSSHYFCHVINEAKASLILASRGNELIEELRVKESSAEVEREAQILLKIKSKMDRIKATQQRVLEENEPKHHAAAIRSGDYYMFEDVEDEFELDTLNNKDSDDEEEKKSATRRRLSKKMNFSQLLEKMKEDAVKERVEQLEQEEREKQKKLSATRRSSSPVLRQSYSAHPSTDVVVVERSALSEPIPPHTQFDPSYSFDDKTEGLIQKDGQKPSTSKEHRDDDDDSSGADDKSKLIKDKSLEDGEEIETDAAKKRKMLYAKLMMIPTFISSLLVSLTLRLHRVSRSYRYVMRALTREKKVLKHSPGFGAGFRSGSNMIWTPIQHAKQSRHPFAMFVNAMPSYTTKLPVEISRDSQMGSGTSAATVAVDDVVISRRGSQSSSISSSSSLNCLAQADSQTGMDDRTDRTDHESFISSARFSEDRRRSCIPPEIRILAPSMERGLDDVEDDDNDDGATLKLKSNFDDDGTLKLKSNFDDDDDGAIDETYEIDEEDFASKEHSIIVELFQAMWYVVLSHTDFICYAMVFLNQINSASVLSLPLPCIVLLWGTLTFPRPSKTFWVTLIAYTQTVVLLKCLCQFEVLWWNQDKILPNQPFAPARILGIERKKGYATYDLILLLVVFCHRIILKSLGLWKSDAVVVEKPNPDVKYKVDEGSADTKAITVGNNSDKLTLTPLTNENGKTDEKDVVVVEEYSDDEDPDFLTLVKISFNKYWSSTREFIRQLFDRQSRKTADVYGFLFLCDFVNFFVILFGFSAFGTQEGDGGIMSYLEENKVPITFLLMLVIQFFLIVVDRALYLRKNMFGKIVYQFILIVGLHIWMFFILPVTTERSFNATNPPVIYYMIKCFHLLFSAYQIRCGYPSRILGNFLTKSFSMLNFAGFKVFINIPFLMELRVLMDWVWTDTTMTLMDWIKMEEIFANIFQLKCSRQMESDLPAPRGQKKGIMAKYLMGGGMILGIILVIWFPMALFAFSAQVGEPNLPYDVSVSLRIGPYEPVYAMSAQDSDIFGLNSDDWVNFNKRYSRSKSALTFLANYEFIDVAAVKLGSNSSTIWNISPPDKDRLLMDLKQNKSLTTRFRYKVMRKSHTKENPGTIEEEQSFEFMGNDTLGTELIKMLESVGNQKTSSIVPFMMPKFIKVKNSGMLRPAHQLLKNLESDDDKANYRNLTLRLFETSISNLTTTQLWWEATESCNEPYYKDIPEDTLYANCHNHITLYLFCDKIFPSTLSSIAGGGIIGLYTTLIFFFSRFLRSTIFSGGSSKIMFDDLPYVDRVLQLCLDIYLVRESLEFTLEEDLYAKLIFLYRSPETMIKWTRPKKEKGDDDTDDSMSTDKKMSK